MSTAQIEKVENMSRQQEQAEQERVEKHSSLNPYGRAFARFSKALDTYGSAVSEQTKAGECVLNSGWSAKIDATHKAKLKVIALFDSLLGDAQRAQLSIKS